MFDRQLIEEFRNTVNDTDFTLFRYREKQNRNQWSCICSAMDWITVAVDHLNTYPNVGARKLDSIEIYGYIVSVDILVEAVQQLHRVICSTTKQLFGKDREHFSDNPFGKTDLDYFKSIRACFGAHPVNLHEPGQEENRKLRRFASWSGGNFGAGDYSIILYSNQIGVENIYLSIDMTQVFAFGEKYYNYLRTAIEMLQKQYADFCERKRKERFEYLGDALSRLHILSEECTKRMNNDVYRPTINELILIFETPITCDKNMEMVKAYKSALEQLIDEIYHNLQEMTLVNLKYDWLLTPSSSKLQNGWGYPYEKLCQTVIGSGYPIGAWRDLLQSTFKDVFEFSYENDKELYVLVQSAIYKLSLTEK